MPKKKATSPQEEEQVAVSILEGMTIPACSRHYGLAEHRCITIVDRYCSRTNRLLYDTLRRLPCDLGAPITELRKHSEEFIRYYFDEDDPSERDITDQSSIWDLAGVQTITINALWEREIETVADLLEYDERRLLRLPKLGKIGLQQLKDTLKKHGFTITGKKSN